MCDLTGICTSASSNNIQIKDMNPGALKVEALVLSLRQPSFISKPHPIQFGIRAVDVMGNVFTCDDSRGTAFEGYIASAPISHLHEILNWQLGLLSMTGLLGIIVSGLLDNIWTVFKSLFTFMSQDNK